MHLAKRSHFQNRIHPEWYLPAPAEPPLPNPLLDWAKTMKWYKHEPEIRRVGKYTYINHHENGSEYCDTKYNAWPELIETLMEKMGCEGNRAEFARILEVRGKKFTKRTIQVWVSGDFWPKEENAAFLLKIMRQYGMMEE